MPSPGMLRCSYIRCKRKVNKKTLHRFPYNNPTLMKQWIENMQVKGFILESDSALCDAHFKLNCFDDEARLRPDAVPTVFSLSRQVQTVEKRRKSKYVVQAIKFYKNFFGKAEKECNKCGFASFSLHVLYMHKYTCEGQLIGLPVICCHCKRRFNFFSTYYKHKSTCVRNHKKKKYWQTKKKLREERKKNKERNSGLTISNGELKKSQIMSCSLCKKSFSKIRDYKTHKLQNMCDGMTNNKHIFLSNTTRHSFSARKTFSNTNYCHKPHQPSDSDLFSGDCELEATRMEEETAYLDSLQTLYKNCFECTHCKNLYPSKKLLFIHLEKNDNCAKAYYIKNSVKTNYQHSARKSFPVVARKSFSPLKANSYHTPLSFFRNMDSHSARKSMHRSTNAVKSKEHSSLHNIICPVCLQQFSNSFNLFHHQRKANHWGKATKSISSICNCPFCDKKFLSVIVRNSHLRSHSDRCVEVKSFLKDTACEICSQHFSSESSKLQHIKLEHSSQSVKFRKSLCKIKDWNEQSMSDRGENEQKNVDKKKLFKNMMISESLKMQMKEFPTKCPICKNTFARIYNRNRHLRIHFLQEAVECKLCQKKCVKVDLKNHMQELHDEKLKFQCAKCKKLFETKLQALQHATRSHPELDSKELVLNLNDKNTSEIKMRNNEFYCDICEISFVKLNSLQRHRQTKYHRDTLTKNLDKVRESLSTLPPAPSPVSEILCVQPEILSCSECAEEFTSVLDFVPHRLSHFSSKTSQNEITDLNPYTCEVCNKIIDNHQKVQFHLFGHLQSRTSNKKENSTQSIPSKTDPIVPDRLCGQHVAKKSFSDKVKNGSEEIVIDGVKKSLFTCETCRVSFTTKYHYTNHIRHSCTSQLLRDNKVLDEADKCSNSNKPSATIQGINFNQVPDNSNSKCFISNKCVQCKICNCVFAGSDTFGEHIDSYCNDSYKDDSNMSDEKKVDLLKSLIDGECIVAGCIRCGFPFDNLPTLAQHMVMHKTKQVTNICEPVSDNLGEKRNESISDKSKESAAEETDSNFNCGDVISGKVTIGNSSKNLGIENDDSTSGIDEVKLENALSDEASAKLDALRKNFSRLLYVLISDPELMEQLGYGDKVIDDVLINVLQQMGETPFHDESNKSELDNLRQNIQILLDICLKENVMEIIADGQTSLDNVVIEALKMLTSEEVQPMEEETN